MNLSRSMLDNDWYIFTMAQMFLHKHPTAIGRDLFKCRNGEITLFSEDRPSFKTMPELIKKLEDTIDDFCSWRFSRSELEWMSKFNYFKPDFLDWLEDFRPKRRFINIIKNSDGTFDIQIDGPITQTIWFEPPILSFISQIYGEVAGAKTEYASRKLENNLRCMDLFHGMNVADMGTRRRHDFTWHEYIITKFKDYPNFVGTSNGYFAKKYNLSPIGTMAHKAVSAYQQLGVCRVADSQKTMFQDWVDEYRGELGIALSDTLGFDKFLKDFDKYFAKLFDGARHDSGDPIEWGNRLVQHYKNFNIDPKTKTAIFSDGLNFDKASIIFQHFQKLIKCSFGIGTKLTNDVGYIPPQIVIKLVMCNGKPVAKISNDKAKNMCLDERYFDYLTHVVSE